MAIWMIFVGINYEYTDYPYLFRQLFYLNRNYNILCNFGEHKKEGYRRRRNDNAVRFLRNLFKFEILFEHQKMTISYQTDW